MMEKTVCLYLVFGVMLAMAGTSVIVRVIPECVRGMIVDMEARLKLLAGLVLIIFLVGCVLLWLPAVIIIGGCFLYDEYRGEGRSS